MSVALPPHPRETFDWLGEGPETTFAAALARGRLHHAWLLTGPLGVGKATFAYRIARRMLGAAPESTGALLGSDPADPVSRQVRARAHPDLLVLQRENDEIKARRQIPVDEARLVGEFFSKSPAAAPWRVAIIDAADDLNAAAANAVLKTLEEPPPRGLLLMVSHSPGRLLATVRSRCRRLAFEPPPMADALAWVQRASGLGENEARGALAMSNGVPGGAWRLAGEGALELDAAARALVASLPHPDPAAVAGLAEGFRPPKGLDQFEMFFRCLTGQVQERARTALRDGGLADANRWAGSALALAALAERTLLVNLDRGDAVQVAVGRLAAR